MSEQNKQLVRSFLEAFGNADLDGAKACLAPNAVAVTKGFAKLSGEMDYDRILATIGGINQLAPDGVKVKFKTMTAEGDRVAVEWESDAMLVNGAHYHNQYCMVFTIEGGKIRHFDEYCCTVHADEVLGPFMAAAQAG